MSILYNKYINGEDHAWYDSSNIVYSVCYDTKTTDKHLKIVFKQGATYLYRNVDVKDYISFKLAESNGKAFNLSIKKYPCIRLGDVDLDKLSEFRKQCEEDSAMVQEAMSNLAYSMEINSDTNELKWYFNGKCIFEGVEGQIDLTRFLNSMGIRYSVSELKTPLKTEEDFVNEQIIQ